MTSRTRRMTVAGLAQKRAPRILGGESTRGAAVVRITGGLGGDANGGVPFLGSTRGRSFLHCLRNTLVPRSHQPRAGRRLLAPLGAPSHEPTSQETESFIRRGSIRRSSGRRPMHERSGMNDSEITFVLLIGTRIAEGKRKTKNDNSREAAPLEPGEISDPSLRRSPCEHESARGPANQKSRPASERRTFSKTNPS